MVNNIRIKGWWMEVMVCMNMAMYDGVDENKSVIGYYYHL